MSAYDTESGYFHRIRQTEGDFKRFKVKHGHMWCDNAGIGQQKHAGPYLECLQKWSSVSVNPEMPVIEAKCNQLVVDSAVSNKLKAVVETDNLESTA